MLPITGRFGVQQIATQPPGAGGCGAGQAQLTQLVAAAAKLQQGLARIG